MKRRGFIQAVAGCVAGLMAPKKAKGNQQRCPDKCPPGCSTCQELPSQLFEKAPPAPAPGQVWETEEGHRVLIVNANERFGRWFDFETCRLCRCLPDSLSICMKIWSQTGRGWRYLGHIRDLAGRGE
jgi:hypothetical protein